MTKVGETRELPSGPIRITQWHVDHVLPLLPKDCADCRKIITVIQQMGTGDFVMVPVKEIDELIASVESSLHPAGATRQKFETIIRGWLKVTP